MIGEIVDTIGTAILFAAPFVLVLIVVVVVLAYPWLVLIPAAVWWVVVKYGGDEGPGGAATRAAKAGEREGDSHSGAAGIGRDD